MILIPEGRFVYGMNRDTIRNTLKQIKHSWADIYDNEFPETEMNIGDFYIDKYEVTNKRYGMFVEEKKYRLPKYSNNKVLSGPEQPVVGVGFTDADLYCKWAGKRLPTEKEWEKAARGTDKRIWPWGNDPDDKKYNGRKAGARSPVKVGSIPAGNSFYDVSDMAGNVWELTSSAWPNDQVSTGKVMKGGSFLNPIGDVRVSVRWAPEDSESGATWLGFRCVMDIKNLSTSSRAAQ